ncbi:MAG: SIR2 family protein [Bacilli bacterium]
MSLTMYYITSNNRKWMRFKNNVKILGTEYLQKSIIFERLSYPDNYVKNDETLARWKLINFMKEFTVPAIVEHSYVTINGTVIDSNIERIFPYVQICEKFNNKQAISTQHISYTFGKSTVNLKLNITGVFTNEIHGDDFFGWFPYFIPKDFDLYIDYNGKEIKNTEKEFYANKLISYDKSKTMAEQECNKEVTISNALHAILFQLIEKDLKNGENLYFEKLIAENIMNINELKDKIKNKQVILFIGAGVSRTLGLVGWRDLVKAMGRDLGFDEDIFIADGNELLVPAEYYANQKSLADIIKTEFIEKAYEVKDKLLNSTIYKKIYDLNFPIIYTTNYDDFIEKYYDLKRKEGYLHDYFKIIKISDFNHYDDNKTAIIKLHGDYSNLDDIVLSEKSFYTRIDLASPLDALFKADMLRKSVLFFGYGLADINVRNWINKLCALWEGNEANRNYSYFYHHCINQVQSESLDKKGIHTITTCLDPYSINSSDMLKYYVENDPQFSWIHFFISFFESVNKTNIDYNLIAQEMEEIVYNIETTFTRHRKIYEFNEDNLDNLTKELNVELEEFNAQYLNIIMCDKLESCEKNCDMRNKCFINSKNEQRASKIFMEIQRIIIDYNVARNDYYELLENLVNDIKFITDKPNNLRKISETDIKCKKLIKDFKEDEFYTVDKYLQNSKESLEKIVAKLIYYNYIYSKEKNQSLFKEIESTEIKENCIQKLNDILKRNAEVSSEILYISLSRGIYHKIAMDKLLDNLLDVNKSYNQFHVCIKILIYDKDDQSFLIFKRKHNCTYEHTWENYGKCLDDYETISQVLDGFKNEIKNITFKDITNENTDISRINIYYTDLDNIFENIVCVASFHDDTIKTLLITFLANADLKKFSKGNPYKIYTNGVCSTNHEIAECYSYNDMCSVILPEIREEYEFFKTKERINQIIKKKEQEMYMKNIFNTPKEYINELISTRVFPTEMVEKSKSEYNGKSMMCAWITKLCPLECEKCFFKSNMNHRYMLEEEYQLSKEGIQKLIAFVNASNSGYLMLSGGGDPMMCPDNVCEILEKVETNRIVIVTSGFWAKNKKYAETMVSKLYEAYYKRKSNDSTTVVIRLSVDEFHAEALGGYEAFENLITIFKETYAKEKHFVLAIHTMKEDDTLQKIATNMNAQLTYGEVGESDNNYVIKIVPKKAKMIFDDEYTINIGISKLFYSDLMVNLCDHNSTQVIEAIKVMTDDIENSEQDNPSYIQNSLGKKGLDFWLDYNGNITTWFNQDWDSIYNIYTQTYDKIVEGTFTNPTSARFLKKGYENRNAIISEVNPLAVLRARAINLRDYVAAFLLEEDTTKLYYTIRGLREYCAEYALNSTNFGSLSTNLKRAILDVSQEDLIDMYKQANYDILDQYLKEDSFQTNAWEDIFLLIALGHYNVDENKLKDKISFYNSKTNSNKRCVADFKKEFDDEIYIRLHKRISFMQEKAYNKAKERERQFEI